MEKHGKLVLLFLVLAALAVAGWLVLGSGSGVVAPASTTQPVADDPAALSVPPSMSVGKDDREERAPARTAVAPALARPQDDPEITAALAKFIGRVVSHDGKPAQECVVRFFRIDPRIALLPERDLLSEPIADFPELVAGEATTGSDGRFEIAGVWPRSIYMIKADATGPNPTLQIADRTPGPAETVDLGDIELKNGAVVTGRIVDESGDPVAGAMVRAADVPPMITQFVPIEEFDPEGWIIAGSDDARMVVEMPGWVKKYWKELPLPTTQSAADGSFRLEGVEPGVNLVVAVKAGYITATQKNLKLEPGQQRAIGKLVLQEGDVVGGKVVDTAGKPLAGVQVVVGARLTVAPVAFGRDAGVTDARGEFECRGFKSGDVIAAVRRAPGEPWTITPAQSMLKPFVITLPSRRVLTLRLISEVGRPIESPRIALYGLGGKERGGMAVPFAVFGFAHPVPIATRQRKLEDGRIQIADLEAGGYVVMVKAAGHGAAVDNVDLSTDMEAEVRLPAAHSVDVLVHDGADKPIANAAVYMQLKGKAETFPVHAGRTDAAGKLTIRDAAGEAVVVEATHPRYGSTSKRTSLPATGPVTLELAEPGAIEGEVTEDGKPPEPGKYMVVANRPWSEEHGPVGGMPSMTVLDLDGKFALRGLQPGKWRVEVVKSLKAIRSFGSMAEGMYSMRVAGELPEREVDLTAGKTVQVRFETNEPHVVDGPSANVSGTLIVDGRPGVGMTVQGWSERQRAAEVDAAGQFDFGAVKEGHIYLSVIDSTDDSAGPMRRELWSQSVEVKAGNNVYLPIEITTGGVIGEVYGLDGRPAAGVWVNLSRVVTPKEPGRGGGRASAVTDSEGRFEVKRLPAGSYSLVAQANDKGRGTAVAQVTSGARATVRVDLRRTFSVSGRLDLEPLGLKKNAEEGDAWVWVTLEPVPKSGDPSSTAGRSSGGRVDVADGSFKVDQVSPGQYRMRVHSSAPGQWENSGIIEVIDGDLRDLQITPSQKPPPPAAGQKKG